MTDQDGGRQGERLHDLGHIRAVSLNRVLVRRARAVAMTAQIDGNGLVACGEICHLRVPVCQPATKSVDEHDRRTTLAGDDMVDEWHGQARGRLSHRQPSSAASAVHKASSASWRLAMLQFCTALPEPPTRLWTLLASLTPDGTPTVARTTETILLGQRFEGRQLNTSAMTDIETLTACLLANAVTIRIPRHQGLQSRPDPGSSLRHHIETRSIALAGERLVADCHRHHLRQCLLEDGHRAFFDRVEGGGPDGLRLHFFCLDPSAVTVLRAARVGEVGPGETVHFNAEEFVIQRLRQLERSGRLDKPNDWWWFN